jgi:acetyl-CoA carboxylase carboxyltransferase component
VQTDDATANGQSKITTIIGKKQGLGVENLRGSGTIAGSTSRAYDSIFTLTYCSGRCVGIGGEYTCIFSFSLYN